MRVAWVHADPFLHSVASPFHSVVTTVVFLTHGMLSYACSSGAIPLRTLHQCQEKGVLIVHTVWRFEFFLLDDTGAHVPTSRP